MKNRKEAFEDAVSATKAAIAEGIVPGGGLALLRAVEAIAQEETKCDGDERIGLRVLKNALEAPARQIAINSSVAGIVDPTKAVRIALENAVSVASVLLLTEAWRRVPKSWNRVRLEHTREGKDTISQIYREFPGSYSSVEARFQFVVYRSICFPRW